MRVKIINSVYSFINIIKANFILCCTAIVLLSLSSCKYKQDFMFQTEYETLKDSLSSSDGNYVLQKRDFIEYQVYTSKGELIIDPNFQLRKELGSGGTGTNNKQQKLYLIKEDGFVNLPMIGEVELLNLTLAEAKEVLEEKYSAFYTDSYILLSVSNRRVIVLGAQGGTVIPLENEKMTLLEILALYGGVQRKSKAYNIRVIRGDLKDPHIQIIDLSTIEGMKKANLEVYPNDVIYIEPVRRVVFESLNDIGPIFSFVTTIISLGVLIISLNNNN